MDDIKVLSKRLESLKITKKASSEMNEQSDEAMSIVPALAMMNDNIQTTTPKSMIPDPE